MKKLLLCLAFWLCFPAAAAQADQSDQFWTDYKLRLEAEEGELELTDSYVDPDGEFIVKAWWFDGKKGLISQLTVLSDVFFLYPYQVVASANQPWLDEFAPGLDHFFTGNKKIGELNISKAYTWFNGVIMWEYRIRRYYQHLDGKSFFCLHKGQTWIFWVIDPLAEAETTL